MTLHLPQRELHSRSSQPQHNSSSPARQSWGSTPRVSALLPLLLIPLLSSCGLVSQLNKLSDRNLPSQAQAQEAEQGESTAQSNPTSNPPTSNPPSSPSTKARSEAIAVKPTDDDPSVTAATPPKAPATPPRMSLAASTAKTPNSNVIAPPPAEADPQAESLSGALRVGNQTEHPLRIAFLAQGHVTPSETTEPPAETSPDSSATETEGSEVAMDPASQAEANAALRDPFHWDFAPGEGGRDGLLLALPQGDLALKTGDVVVAFAQDGSQRYWGPYVVGQTPLPYWNGDREEWQLLVQP